MSVALVLTETQAYTLITACNVAADQYDKDAAETVATSAKVGGNEGLIRLARQFKDQAEMTRRIASYIESSI